MMDQRHLSFPELSNVLKQESNEHVTPATKYEEELENIGKEYITSTEEDHTDKSIPKRVLSRSFDNRIPNINLGALGLGMQRSSAHRKSNAGKLMAQFETNDPSKLAE